MTEANNEAIRQLERHESYLAADADNTALLAQVIDLSLAAGQPERAERHVQGALLRHPQDDFLHARLATVYLAQRRWVEAEAAFAALLTRHADINLAYNLAYALQWQGRHGDACAALAPYVGDAALTAPMATLLVRALHHLGEGEQAIALAESRMAEWGQHAALLSALSLVHLDAGNLEQAESLSTAALAQVGERSTAAPIEALVTAGSLALARTNGDAAIAHFQAVLARDPQEGRSWSGLGTASLLKRDLGAAQQQMEQAVQYMPGHIGSWQLLGWSRFLDGKFDSARAAFEKALELDRNFGESHGALAVVQAQQGQRAAAEASIARALGLDAEGLSARYAQMILAGHTQDPERFRALALRLLSSRQGAFGQNLGELVARQAGPQA